METSELLEQRSSKHGDAVDQFAVAQMLKEEFQHHLDRNLRYEKIKGSVRGNMIKEGLDMIATKLSRILVGDCTFYDHWQDIGGYGKIVSDFLEKEFKNEN